MITTPARAFETRGSQYDWAYKTTMIDRPDYTRVEKPNTRGKVLGGSSCLNYYTWIRGSKATFDDWAEFGGETWNWENTKEYFDKVCYLITYLSIFYTNTPSSRQHITMMITCTLQSLLMSGVTVLCMFPTPI